MNIKGDDVCCKGFLPGLRASDILHKWKPIISKLIQQTAKHYKLA